MKIIIVGKTMKDAIKFKDNWISKIPQEKINVCGKHYVTFKDGTVVDCVSEEEKIKGRTFDIAFLQIGIDSDITNFVIAQSVYSIIPRLYITWFY